MNANQVRDMQSAMEDARVAARLSAETIAAQQAALREEEAANARYEAKLATLIVAASAAYDYFSDKTDADLIDGTFRGNREAGLASELAEAIRRAKGERL